MYWNLKTGEKEQELQVMILYLLYCNKNWRAGMYWNLKTGEKDLELQVKICTVIRMAGERELQVKILYLLYCNKKLPNRMRALESKVKDRRKGTGITS